MRTLYAYETLENPRVIIGDAPVVSATVGDTVKVAGYSADSKSGNASVKITAVLGSESFDVGADGFRPEKAGTYKITYTATDYIGQVGTASYDVEVAMSDQARVRR